MRNGIRRFRISLWGFNRRDVTEYLSTIFDESERILEDNQRLLGKTLADAQAQAEMRADAIVKEAQARADAIVAAANEYSDTVRRENLLIRSHHREIIENAERAFMQFRGEMQRLEQD